MRACIARAMKPCMIAATLLLVAAGGVRAQALEDYDYENLALRGVGFDIGRMWPTKVEPATIFGARADLGYLGPGVRIVPAVGFWSSHLERAELERLAQQLSTFGATVTADQLGRIDWRDFFFGVDAHYVWTAPGGVLTYAGAGVGLHALNGSGDAIEDTFVEDLLDSFSASVDGIGGLEYAISPRFRVYGEGRLTLMSDLRYATLKLGFAIMAPPAASAAPTSNESARR